MNVVKKSIMMIYVIPNNLSTIRYYIGVLFNCQFEALFFINKTIRNMHECHSIPKLQYTLISVGLSCNTGF